MPYTHRDAIENWKHFPIDQTGYESDENQFSNKAIITDLLSTRATVIKNYLSTGGEITEQMVQVLSCVEMEELDRNLCPCAPASGCYWQRSVKPIPRFIRMNAVTGIVANGNTPRFEFIKWDRFQYIPKSRVLSMRKGKFWTVRPIDGDNYLYIYGDHFLEVLAITGIWENPMEAAAYPSCGNDNLKAKCSPLDVDFHTDAAMRDMIIQMSWQKLLPIRGAAPMDEINDDKFANRVR